MVYLLKITVLFYRKFLRGRFINRTCIYKCSCSEFALQIIQSRQYGFVALLRAIHHRIIGCGISSVTVSENSLEFRNGHNEIVLVNELTLDIQKQYQNKQKALFTKRNECILILDKKT